MDTPFSISVILPVYNAQPTLAEALASLFWQTYPPTEVIVVDDGSTDGSAALLVNDGRLRYHWQSNAGPAAARNLGLDQATGDLVAFLDADDIWPEHTLATLVTPFVDDPTVAIAQGYVQDIALSSVTTPAPIGPPWLGFNLGSALFRRSVFAKVGRLNPTLRQGEDIDFWVQVKEQGITPHIVDTVTLLYRRKPSDQADVRSYHSRWLHRLKRGLDRQRASQSDG